MMAVRPSPTTVWTFFAGMPAAHRKSPGGGEALPFPFTSLTACWLLLNFDDQLFTQLIRLLFCDPRCNRREIDSTRFKVEDLREGDEYEFRVQAYNEAGPSRPSTTAGPIIIQDQSCESRTKLSNCIGLFFIFIPCNFTIHHLLT